jgi:beta-mannosidase
MRNAWAAGCLWTGLLLGIGGSAVEAQTPSSQLGAAQNLMVQFNHGWQFRQVKKGASAEDGWLRASVPGDVHLDLLANKKIPDPFARDNEAKLQWIEKESWEYRLNFNVSAALLARSNVDLVFDGIDGPATIWLNGAPILEATNSFRTWRVPAKAHLRAGRNTLHVVFAAPLAKAAELAAKDAWIARSKTEPKTLLRKPAYEFGWDWGPRFVTSGLWKPVRLEAWDAVRIDELAIRQKKLDKDAAQLVAEITVEAARAGSGQLTLVSSQGSKPGSITKTVALRAGSNRVELPLTIRKPKLWYPAGYGAQPLYRFTARVGMGSNAESKTVETGLRTVELRREPDAWGRSFTFVVNGIPVFAKGANVIPFDSFPNRVTVARQRQILTAARAASMNMLRHWGGGYYESDAFYTLCDRLGLMVWQDFQFGNDWQPGSESFERNVEAEARDQVKRLRAHPSIVLWSGNNETELAYNWSPRAELAPEVRKHIFDDYVRMFNDNDGVLKRVVAALDPDRPYWPSSPSANGEKLTASYRSGDEHLWDVWHQHSSFTAYEQHHARFVSEFGFQSFPELRTVESFTDAADRANIFTPVMKAHQKNAAGNAIIREYLLKDYDEPKDFASFLYVSQVLQAEGVKIGAEHFRRSRPQTMGALFWQLNDCWPVASWSSIDYAGRWKALQYYARRFYAPVLISPHVEEGAVKFFIVSDKTAAEKLTLRARLMTMEGKTLLEESKPVEVAPLASKVSLDWPLKRLADAGATDTAQVFVVAELTRGTEMLSRNLLYLAPTKAVQLKPAALTTELTGAQGHYTLRVSSPVLARDVDLSFGNLDVQLDDNYFDLLPGETRLIHVTSKAPPEKLRQQRKATSLVDAFRRVRGATMGAAR